MDTFSELEQTCLTEFVQVLSNLHPYLVQCYNHKEFPRTNNELERSIRRLKTQYRRISGRKNWNKYLLPTRPGGNRMQLIVSNWSIALLA